MPLARKEGLLVTGGSDYHGDEGTRARMGRLPCGWHALEHDIAALTAAMALATPSDHLQKEQQDVNPGIPSPAGADKERLL